jgi:hypothetical protein
LIPEADQSVGAVGAFIAGHLEVASTTV